MQSAALAFGGFLLRDFFPFAARLGQADGNRLLAALDLLSAPAAPERSFLALAHCALDILGSTFRVFACHGSPFGRDDGVMNNTAGRRFAPGRRQTNDASERM